MKRKKLVSGLLLLVMTIGGGIIPLTASADTADGSDNTNGKFTPGRTIICLSQITAIKDI